MADELHWEYQSASVRNAVHQACWQQTLSWVRPTEKLHHDYEGKIVWGATPITLQDALARIVVLEEACRSVARAYRGEGDIFAVARHCADLVGEKLA